MKQVYVDGQHGTSGLKLSKLLENHPSVNLLKVSPEQKRVSSIRAELIESADLIILCLPESSVKNTLKEIPVGKKIIDCSNAFRCDSDWIYGLPELGAKRRQLIQNSNMVVNPGCFATAFILLMRPLVQMNFMNENSIVSASAMNGYSAGGARMIKLYETEGLKGQFHGLNQQHRHLPEMMKYSGLKHAPAFIPIVGNYKEGLILNVPLNGFKRGKVLSAFRQFYGDEKFIKVIDSQPDKLSPICESANYMNIYITGTEERLIVTAKMSNLLKGAASNALQNMNLMLDLDECLGL